jgi:hypothetical protein
MAVTATQLSQLRRMCNLADDDAVYTDGVLTGYITKYALPDRLGTAPTYVTYSGTTPVETVNGSWLATYDLNAAAADVWQERASGLVDRYDFSADSASYSRSQQYQQYMQQARYYRARRAIGSINLTPYISETYLENHDGIVNN